MTHKRLIPLILLFIQCAHGNYLVETDTQFYLRNKYLAIQISKQTGNIEAIVVDGKNILSQEAVVDLNIYSDEKDWEIVEIDHEDNFPRSARIYFKKVSAKTSLDYYFVIDTLAFKWEIGILSKFGTQQEVNVHFRLPVVKHMNHFFYPAKNAISPLTEIDKQTFTYRRDLFLPMFSALNINEDCGLSFITPIEIPKPELIFSIDRMNLLVSYNHLRAKKNKKVKTAVYIIPHRSDWREGLGFLLKKYPEYFYPAVEHTRLGEGWYYLGNPFIAEKRVRQIRNNKVQWIELHSYFPFYGLYTPIQKSWALIFDSDIISLDDWREGVGKKRNSYDNIQNSIQLWHKYDIQVYLYFQIFEAWYQYADRYFVDDIAYNKNGEPHSAWKYCNLMNPDPDTKWGRHIIEQAKSLLKEFPAIDGIFHDRMDYYKYDFAHDDGITMVDNRPTYMLGFAQEKMNKRILDLFHESDKAVWANGPTSVEVCNGLDGIMAEVNLRNLHRIQFLGLVRPIIYLPYDSLPADTEEKLKNALICGAFPSITYGGEGCQRLDEKYHPLFSLIRNREWILNSKPIEIPKDFESNIFKTSNDDYVAIVISPDKSQLMPHPFAFDIPVVIRVADAKEIECCYLLSGDWVGINSLDFKKTKNSISINLPYHLSASAIYLAKRSIYDLVRVSSSILIKGKNEKFIFKVGNPKSNSPPTLEIETAWFKQKKKVTSSHAEFETLVPKDIDGEVEIKINYQGKEYEFTSWVVDPISFMPIEDIFINRRQGQNIPFYFTNNSQELTTVNLKGEFVEGAGKVIIPKKIVLQPFESKIVDFLIVPKAEGIIEFTGLAGKKKIEKSFEVKTSLNLSEKDLFHDDFKNDMINWTVNRGDWAISNGVAQGTGSSHFAFIKNNDWRNYEFEATTRCRGSGNPAVDWLKSYIFFRVQDEKNFYRFGIHGDAGVIDLYRCVDGAWWKLAASLFEPERDRWYTLRIQLNGPQIVGYVDSKKILEIKDTTFATGGVGIGVLEDGMKCEYKHVVVKTHTPFSR